MFRYIISDSLSLLRFLFSFSFLPCYAYSKVLVLRAWSFCSFSTSFLLFISSSSIGQFFFSFLFLFWDIFSLCRSCWPGIHLVGQAGILLCPSLWTGFKGVVCFHTQLQLVCLCVLSLPLAIKFVRKFFSSYLQVYIFIYFIYGEKVHI